MKDAETKTLPAKIYMFIALNTFKIQIKNIKLQTKFMIEFQALLLKTLHYKTYVLAK